MFSLGAVDIGLNDEGKVYEIGSGRLNTIVSDDHPLMKEISRPRSLLREEMKREVKAGADGKSVPVGCIWLEFGKRADSAGFQRARRHTATDYDEVDALLEKLNGTVRIAESAYVGFLAQYMVVMKDRDRFQGMVQEARTGVILRDDTKHPDRRAGDCGLDRPAEASDDE
jgi:hypothetical protein